jgi:hypothetical protein
LIARSTSRIFIASNSIVRLVSATGYQSFHQEPSSIGSKRVTLDECQRRVNEIVLLAFQLRGRRRKARTALAQLKILPLGTEKRSR